MASPAKPWERGSGSSASALATLQPINAPKTTSNNISSSNGSPALPPRVPPRSAVSASAMGMGMGMGMVGAGPSMMGGGGGGYGGAGMYGAGNYGSYGSSYGGGYGGYGMGGYGAGGYNRYGGYGPSALDGPNTVSRAQASTQNAFQAIESVVRAFSSVTMMIESTFHATYSSFRAMIDVADHFTRLRNTMVAVLSPIAIIQLCRRIINTILGWLRLRREERSATQAGNSDWAIEATTGKAKGVSINNPNATASGPILVFFVAVFLIPWALWKMAKQDVDAAAAENAEGGASASATEDGQQRTKPMPARAICIYDFEATREDELSIRSGERLTVLLPPNPSATDGWVRARVSNDRIGWIPLSYVSLPDHPRVDSPEDPWSERPWSTGASAASTSH